MADPAELPQTQPAAAATAEVNEFESLLTRDFNKLYEDEFGMPGGQPFGSLMCDYYFDHSAPDVEMLAGIAQISAAAHAPFLTAASPTLLNMETWQELSNPRDLAKIFGTPE